MKTRSVASSHVLLVVDQRATAAGGPRRSRSSFTRLGPAVPRCSHTAAAPGPPLKTYVIGRVAGSSAMAELLVRDEEQVALVLPRVVLHRDRAGGRAVLQDLPGDRDLMLGDGKMVAPGRLLVLAGLLAFAGLGLRAVTRRRSCANVDPQTERTIANTTQSRNGMK